MDAAAGIVYFGSMKNQFYAINVTSNSKVWNFTTSGAVSGPCVCLIEPSLTLDVPPRSTAASRLAW